MKSPRLFVNALRRAPTCDASSRTPGSPSQRGGGRLIARARRRSQQRALVSQACQDPFSVESASRMRLTNPRTVMSGSPLRLRRSCLRCGLASWRTQLTGRSCTCSKPSLPQWDRTNRRHFFERSACRLLIPTSALAPAIRKRIQKPI